MSQINQPPWGLQDLLGSKNFGDNPSELAASVIPSIEMVDFLTADKIDYERATGTVTARGQNVVVSVPQGELWLVISAAGVASPDLVGDSIGALIDLLEFPNAPFNNVPYVLANSGPPEVMVSTGDFVTPIFKADRGFLPVWSGTKIRLRVASYLPAVTASVTLELQVQFVRLNI